MKRFILTLILCTSFYQLKAQNIQFPLNMDAQAFKDSLVALFNHPFIPKTKEGFTTQAFTKFPWLKAIDDHPRYKVSLHFESDSKELIIGYSYVLNVTIRAINSKNGNMIGDYAPVSLPMTGFNTGSYYNENELLILDHFRKIYRVGWGAIEEDFILPDDYAAIGLLINPIYSYAKEYKTVMRPDGRKFDKNGSYVIEGYKFSRIMKIDFDGRNNLNFEEADWKRIDSIRNSHFSRYLYNLNVKYFTKHKIEQDLIEDIVANLYVVKSEKGIDWKPVLVDLRNRQLVDSIFNAKKNQYVLAGLHSLNEANNVFISSDIFACIAGDCKYGEGTVDMGKTTFTGEFRNSFAISGILSEKSSGRKIKINQSLESFNLNDGEYLTGEDQKVSFYRKYDTIYFNVDTPKFTYVGTTKAFTADGGLLDGLLTQKKEDVLEIFTYRNGELDTQTATLRAKGAGEYEYTGPYKIVDGNMVPFGKGIIKYPMYSVQSAEIEVTDNLYDAMLESPESKRLLTNIFSQNSYIGSKVLGKWHKQYLAQKDAERYKFIQTLSNEDLLKYVYQKNSYYYNNNKAAVGGIAELLLGNGFSPNGNLNITLISKTDVKSSICISVVQAKDNGGNKKDPKTGQWVRDIDRFAEADKGCFYFEKRGDVRTHTLKVEPKVPYSFKAQANDGAKGDYYVIFVDN